MAWVELEPESKARTDVVEPLKTTTYPSPAAQEVTGVVTCQIMVPSTGSRARSESGWAMTMAPLLVCQRGGVSLPRPLRAPTPSGSLLDHSTVAPSRAATVAPSLATQTSRLAGRLTPTILRGASTRVAHTGLEASRDSPETLVLATLTVPSELTDRGVPPVGASPSRTEVVDDADVGASDAEGAAEPAEEGVAEASEDGAADAVEKVSEEASGAAEDGAVDEAGSSADVLDSAGSCEGEVVGSAAEIVDGLAGLLIPEARSMLIRSPQSRVFALILQLRLCPASSSGKGDLPDGVGGRGAQPQSHQNLTTIRDHPQDHQLLVDQGRCAAGVERTRRGLLAEVGQVLLRLEDRGLDQ